MLSFISSAAVPMSPEGRKAHLATQSSRSSRLLNALPELLTLFMRYANLNGGSPAMLPSPNGIVFSLQFWKMKSRSRSVPYVL